ncbi:hypothetical protein FF38_02874 [Lucilia cuprina]|uniref:Uncharacterized protein n=1 Tax=Lucilia cuprina TaxID=7375 RepID=A0A0L0CLB9_LUCCU|nr:hypothetical protein FF38_02874 [Lucilia cuprina]
MQLRTNRLSLKLHNQCNIWNLTIERASLEDILNDLNIKLHWLPGHANVPGNNVADVLADARSGRLRILEKRTERSIIRSIQENPKLSAVELNQKMRTDLEITVSDQTVRRCDGRTKVWRKPNGELLPQNGHYLDL